MNKFLIVGIILIVILGGGFAFNQFADNLECGESDGEDKHFNIVSKRLEWRYEPEEITVEQCDRITVTVSNEDNFDHGFAIDAFGVSQRLPANGTIEVSFVATKSGTFPFYCSVSCSDSSNPSLGLQGGVVEKGPYAGTFRGHFEHIGQFVVAAFQRMMDDDHGHAPGTPDDHHDD